VLLRRSPELYFVIRICFRLTLIFVLSSPSRVSYQRRWTAFRASCTSGSRCKLHRYLPQPTHAQCYPFPSLVHNVPGGAAWNSSPLPPQLIKLLLHLRAVLNLCRRRAKCTIGPFGVSLDCPGFVCALQLVSLFVVSEIKGA
jgi:hypothetical protein